jgi:hypothetical protein
MKSNWVIEGYDILMLLKTLLKSASNVTIVVTEYIGLKQKVKVPTTKVNTKDPQSINGSLICRIVKSQFL